MFPYESYLWMRSGVTLLPAIPGWFSMGELDKFRAGFEVFRATEQGSVVQSPENLMTFP